MRKHRKLLISTLLVIATGAGAWYLWSHPQRLLWAVRALPGQGPPRAMRILPDGDLLLYADIRPLHLVAWHESKPVQLEGDYQKFVDQTGIQFERDLDEVAMSRSDAADGRDVESSEVFVGRFDRPRLDGYLAKNASQTEAYHGRTIFTIPNQGHTVRVCVLDGSTIAVTNMISPEPMHGMIAGRQSGQDPSLLAEYFQRVPLGSLAWMIDRIPGNSEAPQLPGGLTFGFLENTVAVVSLRYTNALLLRADVLAPTEADARRVMNSAAAFLLMYRSVGQSLGAAGGDPDVKAALKSIQVEQKGNSAIFTATLSDRFLKKIVADTQLGPSAPGPASSENNHRSKGVHEGKPVP
jgi:hypothetical protein